MSARLLTRVLAATLVAAAPALAQTTQPAQAAPAPKHHSKIKGALVGGAAGAAVGHPKSGAVAGALYQHHKNKKAAKAAAATTP